MKTNIFIPEKIKVGFQERQSTYTGKLAYVIYYDQKGVLRKEKSWQGWRDKSIPDLDFDNVPTSGFVLNKKVGDYVSYWNHRQAYVRVYDSRDFEFEITIENLLYILENTSSIKGKGLEGQFVYGWSGKDLVLIPTSSPDYIEISEFNKIIHEKNYVKAKDLKLGATYKTKQNEEWIYMGRFDYHNYSGKNLGKKYFFHRNDTYSYFETLKTLGDKLISIVSEDCVDNYAELMEKLESTTDYSPYDESKDEYVPYDYDDFATRIKSNHYWWKPCYTNIDGSITPITINVKYQMPNIFRVTTTDRSHGWSRDILLREASLEEVFNLYKPMYKNKYLANGKLYQKGE